MKKKVSERNGREEKLEIEDEEEEKEDRKKCSVGVNTNRGQEITQATLVQNRFLEKATRIAKEN